MLVFFGFSLPFRHRECDLGGVQKGFSFFLSFSFADLSVPARRTQPSSQHGGAPSGPISRGLIPPLPIFDNVETTFFFFFFFYTALLCCQFVLVSRYDSVRIVFGGVCRGCDLVENRKSAGRPSKPRCNRDTALRGMCVYI